MTPDHLALLVVILGGYLLIGAVVVAGFCRAAALGDVDLDSPMRWTYERRVTLPTGQDDDGEVTA